MTEWPPWAVMWTLSIGMYGSCKYRALTVLFAAFTAIFAWGAV